MCVFIFIFIYIYIFFSARSHLFAFTFIRIVTRDVPGTLVFIYYCFFSFHYLYCLGIVSVAPDDGRVHTRICWSYIIIIYINYDTVLRIAAAGLAPR